METIEPIKTIFMPQFQRFEPAARDSTAIRAFKKCPRYYFFSIVCGFRLVSEDSTPLDFGTCYHRFRQIYTESGGNPQTAMLEALKLWPGDPPVGSKWDFLTKERLVKSCLCAVADIQKHSEIKVLAAEQTFDLLLSDGKTRRGGIADEFILRYDEPWGRDFKATSRTENYWERQLNPNDQFTGYIWGLSKLSGRKVKGLIVDCMMNSKVKDPKKAGPRIRPFLATRTPGELDRWEEEQIFWEEIITRCRVEDKWPMADDSQNCMYCPFRGVCSKSSLTSAAANLEAHYVQKPHDYKSLHKVGPNV